MYDVIHPLRTRGLGLVVIRTRVIFCGRGFLFFITICNYSKSCSYLWGKNNSPTDTFKLVIHSINYNFRREREKKIELVKHPHVSWRISIVKRHPGTINVCTQELRGRDSWKIDSSAARLLERRRKKILFVKNIKVKRSGAVKTDP